MKNVQHPAFSPERPMAMRLPRHGMFNVECWALNVLKFSLVFAIRAYQLTISPTLIFLFGGGAGCRFTPTCSHYAMDAVQAHGALAGGALAARRICRCHPWGGCGHDPVPKAAFGTRNSESRI
jgi:uncharacterized protein